MHIKWRDDVIHSHKQEMGDIVALASDIIGVLTVVCWKRSCRVGDQRNGKVVFHAQHLKRILGIDIVHSFYVNVGHLFKSCCFALVYKS